MKMNYRICLTLTLFAIGCNNEKTLSFTKTFEGTMGENNAIMLKIKADEGKVEGNCLYRNTGKVIQLKGIVDPSGSLNFKQYDENGKQTGVFKGNLIRNSIMSGVWSSPDGGKALNYSVVESNIDFEQAARESALQAKAKNETREGASTPRYTNSDLIGGWWNPHFAVRKIRFNDDDTFELDAGGGALFEGTYEIDGDMARLTFKNKTEKRLKISGGNGERFGLSGDGEDFVRE